MAEQIIRKDIIQLSFDTDYKGLDKANDALDDLRKSVVGDLDKGVDKLTDGIDDLKKSVTGVGKSDGVDKLKDSVNDTSEKVPTLNKKLKETSSKLSDIGKKASGVALNGLKKLTAVSFKGLLVGAGAAAAAIGKITYESVQAFSEYEQLKGGMEKIFDKADIAGITKDANNAYRDLGLSANDYMRIINDTGATFAAVMGDQKGYETAKTGLHAISDYATGTGKDINLLSEKFTMITRSTSSYQSIADQFSGILPATSKDFLKQSQAAGLLSKKYSKLTDVPIAEYQQAVSKMLKKGVADLGLAGNTAAEAEKTVSGSLGMMKSSWGNLLVAIGSGENLDQCFDNLIKSAETFGVQIMPVVERALSGIGTVIEKLTPKIAEKLPQLANDLLPPLIRATIDLTIGLVKALPTIIETTFITLADIVGKEMPTFGKALKGIAGKSKQIAKFIPLLLGIVGGFKAFGAIKSLGGMFGGDKSGGGKSGGLFGGITNTFKSLAKTKPTIVLKGMANLGIILGGFTVLTAAIMAISPYMSKLSDVKSFAKVVGTVAVLGVLGTGLSKLASIVGKIPIMTVVKGLANMAIMLVGMTALTAAFMLVAPHIAELSDVKSIVKVVAVITTLGILGTALSVLAGITGMIPVMAVVKGLANMAIMLVGMTALTAAFMLVAPKVAKLSSNKAVLKVAAIMTVLGGLGTVLSIFAGIAGLIPIPVVLAGLANITLVLGGLTALITAYGALSEIKGFNEFIEKGGNTLASIFNVIGKCVGSIIGGVGEGLTNSLPKIGENLSSFAESLKPMFTTFSGADMSGIGTFFTSMGAFMLTMAGNEILSFFTGGTDFAKLGTDLNTFATNSKGFFTTVSELPEKGFSNATLLFQSLGDIGNVPNTGGVAQWFSGENDYASLATGLGQLGSAKVIDFYNTMSNMPQKCFENVKKFFESLGDIGNVPNTGGLAQWFSGENDYASLASGFEQLGNKKTIDFYTTMGNLPENSFKNAKKFFESLGDIGNVPNTGGISQWFSGENDYASLVSGFEQLGNKKIIDFYTTMGNLPENSFKNAKKLFKSFNDIGSIENNDGLSQWFSEKDYTSTATGFGQLADVKIMTFFRAVASLPENGFEKAKKFFKSLSAIGNIPNNGGLSQWTSANYDGLIQGLSVIGEGLQSFSETTVGFFDQVNNLNLSNLNGLWSSLENSGSISTDVSKIVDANIEDIVNKISTLPKKMGDGLNKSSSSLSSSLVSIWKDAVKASAKPVNKLIDGANWILKEFGSNKSIASWTPYAKGTNGHKGGNALVNDGRGAELVQMPNGKAFIPKGKNVFLPNAPKGMKVLPAERTAQLMGKKSPTFRYANGTGTIDIWNYIDNPSGLINSVSNDYVDYNGVTGIGKSIGKGMVTTIKGEMSGWAKKLYDEFGVLSLAAYNPSKGVEQWRSTVIRALKMEGLYSASNVARTLYQMQTESGGNPKAINLWDSNAKKGIPSKGLMQVIDPTFKAYARAGFNKNIYDPLSNILASVRYAVSRYGSLAKAYRGVGYANGGFANKPSIFGEDGLEAAIPLSRGKRKQGISLWQRTGEMLGMSYTPESDSNAYTTNNVQQQNTYAPVFNLTISGASDERTLKRKVKQWIKEAMDETFESIGRINDIDLQEV